MRRSRALHRIAPLSAVSVTDEHFILPNRMAVANKLVGKPNPRETPHTESSKKLVRSPSSFFEVPVHAMAHTESNVREDEYEFEHNMIWAAFDVPEQVPVLLRDRMLAGDAEAFSERWLDTAHHWVREARYWRCIGVERPFFGKHQLRAHVWGANGTDVGNVQMSAAMTDAIRDLEYAVRREAEGLPANYIWDKWGPWGNVDGSRAQHLPRFRADQHQDPDGIEVAPADVAELTSHGKIKERFGHLIFPEEDAFNGAFLTVTNGLVTLADFDEAIQARYAALRGLSVPDATKLASADDIRTLLYVSGARSEFESQWAEAESWDSVVEAVAPHREAGDKLVDGARMLQLCRDVSEIRSLFEEKCGFSDFHMTTDKDLTGGLLAFLRDLKTVASAESGVALLSATIDAQRATAMGEVIYAAYRELMDMDRDKRRRLWAARFSGEANEEKTLDYMLQQFARRTDRPGGSNEPGEDFDRETEPIGRHVQRRVLESDVASVKSFTSASSKSRIDKFAQRVKARRTNDLLEDVKYNQLVRNAFF
jgi:hypothetical protein